MTVRYLNQQPIEIDSRNRESGTHNDFEIIINLDPTKEVDRVVLSSAQIKKSFYLVVNSNNTFTLREGVTDTTITIPVGCYSVARFSTALVTILNARSPTNWTYAMSFSELLGTFDYTCVGGNPSFIYSSNNIHALMGFEPDSTNTFVAGALPSTNMLNFQTDRLRIHTSMVSGGLNDLLETVPAVGPDFSTIVYNCVDGELNSKPFKNNGNRYRFRILDQDGNAKQLTLPVYMEITVWKQNTAIDDVCKKIDGLLDIVKYRLLKSA